MEYLNTADSTAVWEIYWFEKNLFCEFVFIIRMIAMNEIINMLMFLVEEYDLKYLEQTFNNHPFGNYTTKTYSFYNDSGCFTVNYLLQRDELDFYFSNKFSNECKKLQEKLVNIWIDEPEIWKRNQKWIFGIKDPFFWWKKKKIINALAETIRTKIKKNGEFFGVKIMNRNSNEI